MPIALTRFGKREKGGESGERPSLPSGGHQKNRGRGKRRTLLLPLSFSQIGDRRKKKRERNLEIRSVSRPYKRKEEEKQISS